MTAQPEPKRIKGPVTPEAFGRFLQWLCDDRDLALREYAQIRNRMLRYFMHKGCAHEDELFDKTVDEVIRIIDSGAQYSNHQALFFGVGRLVWLEDTRKPRVDQLEDTEVPW